MGKDRNENEIYLPNNIRPMHTGQGLTKKQLKYFKIPRGMYEIAQDLFNGDFWEANHFQNKFIGNGVLKIGNGTKISLIEY